MTGEFEFHWRFPGPYSSFPFNNFLICMNLNILDCSVMNCYSEYLSIRWNDWRQITETASYINLKIWLILITVYFNEINLNFQILFPLIDSLVVFIIFKVKVSAQLFVLIHLYFGYSFQTLYLIGQFLSNLKKKNSILTSINYIILINLKK